MKFQEPFNPQNIKENPILSHINFPTNLLKTFLDSSFFLFCSPFRIKLVNETSSSPKPPTPSINFALTTWLPQKLLCILFTFLHLLWLLWEIRAALPSSPVHPSMHFRLVQNLFYLMWRLTLLKYFWWGPSQHQFLQLAYFLARDENCNIFHSNLHKKFRSFPNICKILPYLLALLLFAFSLANWSTGLYFKRLLPDPSRPLYNWSLDWWWHGNKVGAKAIFFLEDPPPSWLNVLAMLTALGGLHGYFMLVQSYFFLLAIMLILHFAVSAFISSLKTPPGCQPGAMAVFTVRRNGTVGMQAPGMKIGLTWGDLQDRFLALKTLANMINRQYGMNILFFLIQSLLYFATAFVFILRDNKFRDLGYFGPLFVNFFIACGILLGSADTSAKISQLKEWLTIPANRRGLSCEEVVLTLNEVDSHAIRAGNVFPVTHALLANVWYIENILGILVTYSIICAQSD